MVNGRNNVNSTNPGLRKLAEKMIEGGRTADLSSMPPETVAEMLHELQVHQIELELQNEELREAQVELQESRDAYASLYDFAPVGYLTLDRNLVLTNVNFTACKILGEDRIRLIKAPLSRYITPGGSDTFYLCVKNAAQKDLACTCDVKMRRLDGSTFDAEMIIEALLEKDASLSGCRVAIIDVTERKKADAELNQYRDHLEEEVILRTRELRELSHRLVEIQEKERAAIGTELHDDIGQTLTYATLLISQAIRKPDETILRDAQKTVQEAMAKTRELSHMMSPGILKSAGLSMAVECLLSDFTKRTGLKTQFTPAGDIDKIPNDAALAAYRIIQESLTNVVRHAAASEVAVNIQRQLGRLYLGLTDNGIGFDPAAIKNSTGLIGMRERALALGGEFKIDSNQGQGTRVTAELPVPETPGLLGEDI